MKAIFRKELYYSHKIETVDPNAIELYKNLEGEPDWIEWLDGKDITDKEVEANKDLKELANIETIFIINRYNDLAEWEGRIILHPDWVERVKE